MMTPEEDVNASALRAQGWTISAIARHLDRDRKTIRAYLAGERQPGVRRPAGPDPFDDIADYIGQRLTDDPHVVATALFDEAQALGYPRTYPTFTRQDPRPSAAAGLSRVRRRVGQGPHDRDRARSRGGDPVGLGRAARGPVVGRRHRDAAGRIAGLFVQDPWGVL